MGEVYQYHITMLVSAEQEEAIRSLFKQRSWSCRINVISDGNAANMLPVLTKDEDDIRSFEVIELKSEILKEENDVNVSDTLADLKVSKREDASEDDPVVSDNGNSASDNKMQKSDNNPQCSDNTPVVSDNEDTDTYLENVFSSSHSDSSDEASGRLGRSRKGADKKKDSETKYCPKTRSKKRKCKPKKKKFKCPICEMYLASKPSLMRHCQRRHEDEWFEFKCKDCSCMFKKVEELWKHRNEVKHEPPKVLPKFSEKKNLSPEELEQLGHLKCNACGKILPSRRLLRRHFYSDHREWMPDPICAVCGTEFKTRQELWKHKREMKHNDSLTLLQTYQCEECGKILTGGYHSFKLHQKYACKEERAEPQAKCDVCGSMFKSQTHVQQHKQRTHLESPVVCDICGTMCKNKHALNSHKRRHDDKNKKFVCVDCGKAFLTGLLLKMHVRTHTKEKPFKCPLCNYRCAIKQNIQKHSVNVHKTQVKCADIVIINESDVQEPSSKTYSLNDSVFTTNTGFSERTVDSKHKIEKLSGIESLSNEAAIPYENVPHLSRRDFHADGREAVSHDRTLLTEENKDKVIMTSTAICDRALLTNDALVSNESKPQLHVSNSDSHLSGQGNGSQFPVPEGAYNLTMYRHGNMPSVDSTQKVTENFSTHVHSDNVSSGSYVEMMNSGLNPLSYPHTSMDPSQFSYQWGNTTSR